MNFFPDIESLPSITIGKYRMWGTNHQELLGLKKEIFQEEMYSAKLIDKPTIIDAGAHVGMATLFFKLQYPQAKIICIEPNPVALEILKHNVWFNHFDDVEIIEAALSDQVGERTFFMDRTDDRWLSTAGYIEGAWNREQKSESIMVPTLPLDQVITQSIDLLKMDIEGAEEQVLRASHNLHQIKQLIIELHPNGKQLPQLDKILKKHNFSFEITKAHYGLHRLYAQKEV